MDAVTIEVAGGKIYNYMGRCTQIVIMNGVTDKLNYWVNVAHLRNVIAIL